jgi:hypothetical protein
VPLDEPTYYAQGVLPTNENIYMLNCKCSSVVPRRFSDTLPDYNPYNTFPSFAQNSGSDVPDCFVPSQQVPVSHPYSVVHPDSMLQGQYSGQDWRSNECQSRQPVGEQSISFQDEAYTERSFQNPTFARGQNRGKILGGTNTTGNGVRSGRVSKAKKKRAAAVSAVTTASSQHSSSPTYQTDQPFSAPPHHHATSGQLAEKSAAHLAEHQSTMSDAIARTHVNSQVLSKEDILDAIKKQPKFNVGGTRLKPSHKMEYVGTCRLLRDMPVPLLGDDSLEAMATHYAQSPSQKGLDWKDHILHYEQISVRLDAMSRQTKAVRNGDAADPLNEL